MLGIRGAYYIWPVIATVVWTATLVRSSREERSGELTPDSQLGLLLWWIIDDDAQPYKIDHPTVVFISHVGAAHRVRLRLCSLWHVLTSERRSSSSQERP